MRGWHLQDRESAMTVMFDFHFISSKRLLAVACRLAGFVEHLCRWARLQFSAHAQAVIIANIQAF